MTSRAAVDGSSAHGVSLMTSSIDCVERGFVEHAAGMCRIFQDGDIVAARAAFALAATIGEKFRDPELLTYARMGEGRCLIYLGEIAKGLSLLDEAMVSVEAREIPPMAVGDAYCTVIDACPRIVRHPALRTVDRIIHPLVRRSTRPRPLPRPLPPAPRGTADAPWRLVRRRLTVAQGRVHRAQRTDECADARRCSLSRGRISPTTWRIRDGRASV